MTFKSLTILSSTLTFHPPRLPSTSKVAIQLRFRTGTHKGLLRRVGTTSRTISNPKPHQTLATDLGVFLSSTCLSLSPSYVTPSKSRTATAPPLLNKLRLLTTTHSALRSLHNPLFRQRLITTHRVVPG